MKQKSMVSVREPLKTFSIEIQKHFISSLVQGDIPAEIGMYYIFIAFT